MIRIHNQQQAKPDVTWKMLLKANKTLPVPFELVLEDCNESLTCLEIVRVMPGKRMVVFGKWGNKQVVAKLFYDRRHRVRKAQEDYQGVEALLERGVPTPHILYKGTSQKGKIQVLLFERILQAHDLDEIWQNKADLQQYETLLRGVVLELATQHVVGVMQCDLHFKNFLITGKKIYTLDGGDVKTFDTPLPKKETIDNLGLFFSQLGVGTDALKEKLLALYADARGWIIKPHEREKIEKSIEFWNKTRWESYREKIMRNCTAFRRLHAGSSVIMYDRQDESTELLALLRNPESAFLFSDTQILKAGGSSTVAKIRVNNKFYVLKRYNIKNITHGLRRCFRSTRAAESWRMAQYLRWVGIATPRPIAFVEKQFCGLRGQSYFLMEYIKGEHAGTFFTQHAADSNEVITMAERVTHLLKQLRSLRVTHGDLKMTNILIEVDRPVVIDLDGMKRHDSPRHFLRSYQKDIARFLKNWHDHPRIAALFESFLKTEPRP